MVPTNMALLLVHGIIIINIFLADKANNFSTQQLLTVILIVSSEEVNIIT